MKQETDTVPFDATMRLTAILEETGRVDNDLDSLLASINIAVVILDTNLIIQRVTPAAKIVLGLRPGDEDTRRGHLADKALGEEVLAEAKAVLATRVRREAEVSNAKGRVYLRRIQPYYNANNRLDGVAISFDDITDKKQIEEELRVNEQRHSIIMDGIKEYAIFMLDLKGRIVTWTLAAERVLGFTAAEVLGRKMGVLYTEKDDKAGIPEQELQTAYKNRSVGQGGWYVRRDGHRFWGTGTLYAFKDDGRVVSGYIKVLRDNTDCKIAEEQMLATWRAVEQADRAKDCFLTNVSHELRTPLSAILLWTKVLSDEENLNPQELKKGLQAIRRCAEEQQALVEDLVDISRIAAGKMRLDRDTFELVSLLRSAVEAFQPLAAGKGLLIEEYYDPRIHKVQVDPHRLHQIVWNLLSNAAKFTPAGGRIAVSAEYRRDQIDIQIADTGQGISAELLPHVFDHLRQGCDTTDNPSQGLGLGLYITRQLVELHGGSISAKSLGLGKGATFTIRLPAFDDAVGIKPKNSSALQLAFTRDQPSKPFPSLACVDSLTPA